MGQLLIIWWIIGHDPVLTPLVNLRFSINILDDGGVSRHIFKRQMYRRFVTCIFNHNGLKTFHQFQRFRDGRGVIQQILTPKRGLNACLAVITRPVIGRRQKKQIHSQSFFVQPVHRADVIDCDDNASKF